MGKRSIWTSIFLFLLVYFNSTALQNRRDKIDYRLKEKQILDHVLGPLRYDKRIRPPGSSNLTGPSPTVVSINTYLRAIDRIDDYKMEYSVQLTFRENWMDSRLMFNDLNGKIKYLTLTDAEKVWMPDTFFQNEKLGHFHNIIVPNVYVRIFPTGSVLYSIRISLTLACPMDLKLYPLDRQVCEMRIASYGWTTDDLIYRWKSKDPVQFVQDLNLPRFKLESFSTSYCNSKTNTGEYSCLKINLVFKREFSYYLLTIYVPSCMLVIISWVSFWLDSKSVPARVALGVTTLLTMSTQTAGVNRSLPPVAYTKAIDVWSGACVIFVFSALLEFAFVNYASRHDRRKGRKSRSAMNYNMDDDEIDYDQGLDCTSRIRSHYGKRGSFNYGENGNILLSYIAGEGVTTTKKKSWLAERFPRRSKRIDVVARILFPGIFAIFNFSYWLYYLSAERESRIYK
ncbi:glutamate-gated chloride channel isoform X1 [Lepeophtheirus salmonis]|nr:glutamate-gated chloride channel-like [Lepeophtheirus salmonis]XP_040583586.1 glutamate-gated chloride channel-like [Lepeophtheirus salmonis]